MNKIILRAARFTAMIIAVFGLISLVGCKEDPAPTPLVEDGFYIQGAATNYTDFDIKAAMSSTRNEVLNTETTDNRPTLMEIYVPIKGTGGFNIVEVAGSTQTTYGPADFADVVGGTDDQPNVTFQRGTVTESTTTFTVPSDGLYHVVFDTEVKKAVIVPVEYWGLIGGATPGGWSSDTQLPSSGFDFQRMDFEATQVAVSNGDYKFRYSGGWKVELDSTLDLGNGSTGIKVNANFGGALDALVPGGDNINNEDPGYYTVAMAWIEGEGMSATMTRTGDLPATDWSNIELGLIGDGLTVNSAPHDWSTTILLNTPTVSGTVYTYTFNDVTVNTGGGGFKIREGQTWDNTILGYPQVTVAGTGASEFDTNGDGNFVPTVDGGMYNFTLEIDATSSPEVFTFTATKL